MNPDVAAYLASVPLPFTLHDALVPGKCLLLIETRPVPHLPSVVASVVRHHPGWHLYVVGTPPVHELLRGRCTNYHAATRATLDVDCMSTSDYSKLLLSESLWQMAREDHVLVFQADCLVVRPTPASMFRYAYVGAQCGDFHPDTFIMNGGLSLRRRTAMLRALEVLRAHHPDLLDEPEDVAFTLVMRAHREEFELPDMDTCMRFSIETFGDPHEAIGMHGTDKDYAVPTLVKALLASAPL